MNGPTTRTRGVDLTGSYAADVGGARRANVNGADLRLHVFRSAALKPDQKVPAAVSSSAACVGVRSRRRT